MLRRRHSHHTLKAIPTVGCDLAITSKGVLTQWISDSVLRVMIGAVIVGSGFLLLKEEARLTWEVPIIGLTLFFALGCSLGLILSLDVTNSGNRSRHVSVIYDLAITPKGFPTQWISDSVKTILGYEVDAALAPGWWIDCLHPDDKEAAVNKSSILMTHGHLVQEYRFRANDGHYLWIRDEASLLRDAAGRPKQIIGFWSNISERNRAAQACIAPDR